MDATEEQSDSENEGSCGKVMRQHVDHVADVGCRAVFTEQGASVSQTAAAKFFDTFSKLLGMGGETSDAVFSVQSSKDDRSSKIVTIARRRNVLTLGSEFLHDKDQKVGIILTILWCLWKEEFTWSPISRPSMGKNS